jgi:hypothetical protein
MHFMTDLIKVNDGTDKGIISLLHDHMKHGMPVMPKPFERDIFLFDTHVAGTSHVAGMMELAEFLHVGDQLNFLREPGNAYDANAIVIKTTDGVKIGFVPRQDNVVFARLMDAGKLLFGRIDNIETRGNWLLIGIKIYLHD